MNPYYDSIFPESISGAQLDHVLSLGWYRSHQKIFTCSHVDLNGIYRVHWLRYSVLRIQERVSHKRLRSKNRNFTYSIEDFQKIPADHSDLYKRYRESIDFDGAQSIEENLLGEKFAGPNIFNTHCISLFDGNKLIAGGYFDIGEKSAASILHFFDPEYSRFSPGKFLMLITIDYMKARGLLYYYPGYVVQGLPKMNYKLFLGKEVAEYFDPTVLRWKDFNESILNGKAIDADTFKNQLAG